MALMAVTQKIWRDDEYSISGGRLSQSGSWVIEYWHAVKVPDDGVPRPTTLCHYRWEEVPTVLWPPESGPLCPRCALVAEHLAPHWA